MPFTLSSRCDKPLPLYPRLSVLLGSSGDVPGETPNIGAGARRSIPRSLTWWRTPVEDPGRRAGPKIPDEEPKGMRAGTASIFLDTHCGGAGWGGATPGDRGEAGDLGAAPGVGGGGTGTSEPGCGARTTPGIWFPLAYMHCWYAISYRR